MMKPMDNSAGPKNSTQTGMIKTESEIPEVGIQLYSEGIPTDVEAESAMREAQRLMLKYNVAVSTNGLPRNYSFRSASRRRPATSLRARSRLWCTALKSSSSTTLSAIESDP